MFLLFLACQSPTEPEPEAEPDSEQEGVALDHGIAESCDTATAGQQLGDFYDADPKLVVHGEGEEALGNQVGEWFADWLGDYEVVAAADLTEADRSSHDLMIVGGSDVNTALTDLNGDLPVWFEPGEFTFGGYRWNEPGHGIAIYHLNPWNRDHDILLYAGNDTNGAWSLFSIPTGDRDYHLTRGRSEQMKGRLCRDGESWAFLPDRTKDGRADWDAFVAGLESVSSENHVFFFESGSSFDADSDWMPDWQEDEYARIFDMLEVEPLDEPVRWYLYETNGEKGNVTGNPGNGHANTRAYEVHAVYGDVFAVGAHEDVHVVQQHRLGSTNYALLGEGMAVMVDGYWQGDDLTDWAKARLDAGTLPTLTALVDDFWGEGGGSLDGYGAAGSFNRFLFEAYGADTLKALYTAEDLHGAFLAEIGSDTATLEAAWHASLSP